MAKSAIFLFVFINATAKLDIEISFQVLQCW